jgi:malate/lactate dehydrogenase
LKDNGKIFQIVGKALDNNAKRTCKTIVVGNPANTNCLITIKNCKGIPVENFAAMSRLDHNRGLSLIAKKADCKVTDIVDFCVWGNHSPTMYADVSNAKLRNGKMVNDYFTKEELENEFLPCVQQRGAEIIKARKLSSAASAANACID